MLEQELFDLTNELKNISGSKDKAAFIKKHKDNANFVHYLKVVLDKLLVFGIQEKKLNKVKEAMKNDTPHSALNLFDVFEYLSQHNTGRDMDAEVVAAYILFLPTHLQEWATESITKSFKMGATAKSVNKALGYNLIVEFAIQRGKTYGDEKHKFANEDKLISEKFNGVRGICEVTNGKPVYKTRQNQIIEGLQDLIKDMTGVPDGIYEGELIIKDRHRYKLREVLQKTIKIVNSDSPDKKVDWMLFDHLTHEEFAEPETSRGYFERKDNMFDMKIETANVHIADTLYIGRDEKVIHSLLDTVVARGGEGLMANLDRPYKKDKTNHILKIKKKYSSDLRCIGFEEGSGKYKGTLGALMLEYKGNVVKASGMSDVERNEIWNNQYHYLNVIVEIEHEQETSNEKNDLLSLEYPVFQRFRFDKDEHSYAHGED